MIGRSNSKLSHISKANATLFVTVPVGSTVTMTKGGITLMPTMWVQAADNTFDCALFVIRPSLFDGENAWTVTATRGTDTASATVTISSNEQYDLSLSLHVPDEYQEVEYLIGTGSQYINIGYATDRPIKAQFAFEMLSVAENQVLFGKLAGSSPYRSNIFNVTAGGRILVGIYNNDYTSYYASPAVPYTVEFDSSFGNAYVKLNGATIYTSANTNSYFNVPIYLFAANSNGTAGYGTRMKMKYFKLYDESGNLVRELYPCYRKNDSVAGMWDKTNSVFYTNAGSGTFVVGPDV